MTDLTREQQMAAIEGVLFAFGKAVNKKVIMEALEVSEKEIKGILAEMQEKYEAEDRGIRLMRLEDEYQLCTKEQYYEILSKVSVRPQKPVLTDIMLEVLSIIAYKQPVTRGEIERIRGVQSDYAVNRLIEYHLIEEAGRLAVPGRPVLFKTTDDFLRSFGVSSVEDLPGLLEEQIREAKEEAYAEAGVTPEEFMQEMETEAENFIQIEETPVVEMETEFVEEGETVEKEAVEDEQKEETE